MNRIFEGIRVLEFTSAVSGPFSAALLADNGAEVIKVEKATGDEMRFADPFIGGQSVSFMASNRGKKSVTIPINTAEGQAVLKELFPTADVIIENFRPGVMAKYGLDYESVRKIKPDIIYCSISAFGQTGPYRMGSGYDFIAQASSGIMFMTGKADEAPVGVGTILGDYCSAISAFGAISAALYHRERTNEGNYIDLSLVEAAIAINHHIEGWAAGQKIQRSGGHVAGAAPFGIFTGNNNESIVICAHSPVMFKRLAELMGRPELLSDPRFESRGARYQNLNPMVEIVENYLKTFDTIDEAMDALKKAGIPVSKIFSLDDVIHDPHFLERGMIAQLPLPDGITDTDSYTGRGIFLNFSNTPGQIGVPPILGQNNIEVLQELGLDEETIADYNQRWLNK